MAAWRFAQCREMELKQGIRATYRVSYAGVEFSLIALTQDEVAKGLENGCQIVRVRP